MYHSPNKSRNSVASKIAKRKRNKLVGEFYGKMMVTEFGSQYNDDLVEPLERELPVVEDNIDSLING